MILKILAILLLSILGLILAAVLIVLLVPVRYQAYGKRDQETGILTADGKISWLLSIISVRFSYDQELAVSVRIFGHELGKKEETPRENNSADDLRENPPAAPGGQADPKAGSDHTTDLYRTVPSEQTVKRSLSDKEAQAEQPRKPDLQEEQPRKPDLQAEQIRESDLQEKQPRESGLKNTVSEILEFIRREEAVGTLRLLWRQIRRIVRHILPQKIWLQLRFGLEDPAQTGQLVGVISMIPFFYQKGIHVAPVFEGACFDGEAAVKGRIRIGTCACLGLRVIFSRNFWKLFKFYKSYQNKTVGNE